MMIWSSSPTPNILSSPGGPRYDVASLLGGFMSGLMSTSEGAPLTSAVGCN